MSVNPLISAVYFKIGDFILCTGLLAFAFRINKYKINDVMIMKKIWKFAFAAFAVVAFTACGTDNNTTTESDTVETTDETVDTDMDMDEDTTIVVEDTTVNDGVADEIKEEQPPVQQ